MHTQIDPHVWYAEITRMATNLANGRTKVQSLRLEGKSERVHRTQSRSPPKAIV